MSDKMLCPGCDCSTSGIHAAFSEGRPCPVCGLSAEAAQQVVAAQERHADEQLVQQLTDLHKRNGELERENAVMRERLRQVKLSLAYEPPDWDRR